MKTLVPGKTRVSGLPYGKKTVTSRYENLYSPHNSDSSSDKIDTKYTTKIIKINLIRT